MTLASAWLALAADAMVAGALAGLLAVVLLACACATEDPRPVTPPTRDLRYHGPAGAGRGRPRRPGECERS